MRTSVPDHLPTRTLSPALTASGSRWPFSRIRPDPTAITSACCGFSFAVSGTMIPPTFCSPSSIRFTSTRSRSGLTLGMPFLPPLPDEGDEAAAGAAALSRVDGGADALVPAPAAPRLDGFFPPAFFIGTRRSRSAWAWLPPANALLPCSFPPHLGGPAARGARSVPLLLDRVLRVDDVVR